MTVVLGSVSGSGSPVAHSIGDRWEITGTITFSSTYAAGGDAFDPSSILVGVGVGIIDKVMLESIVQYLLTYDYVAKKIKIWDGNADTELANGAYPGAITGLVTRVLVIGR